MAPKNYDFCGWVTKNDVQCSDGRTIYRDAFAHQDGAKVPLIWNHNHDSVDEVLGYTILENRPEGVYGYSYCNDTEKGRMAKALVSHGDIDSYSIFANKLKQNGPVVHHGNIKEVSLVLSPANPGAYIEDIAIAHGDDTEEDCARIYTGEPLEMYHSEDYDDKTTETISHAEESKDSGETVGDVLATLNEDQKKAVAYLLGAVASTSGEDEEEDEVEHSDDYEDEYEDDYDEEELEHSDYEGEEDMKTNVFDGEYTGAATLSHSDIEHIISEAKSGRRTLKEAYEDAMSELAHADGDSGIEYSSDVQNYGVNDPSFLFPEARALNNPPDWIKRPTDWVPVVMNGTKHTPFSRIKSVFANITADEARAKGYIKGNKKTEEVFTLLKRTTTPQTIYKKQKLDRDDIIDITDFNVVSWIRGEMRIMLDEEIARAILVGDGRLSSSDDHISEEHIRPIWKDDSLFTIRKTITKGNPEDMAKDFIKGAIRARKDYKGSGNPTLFTTEDWLTEMLLLEDGIGHPLYKTEAELATKMRVSKIVTVPVMENLSYNSKDLLGIIVNLSDYNVGADKGGEINMFDDFDIDFNQYKYLIETRCSGALIKPYSAIVIEAATANPSQD